MLIKARRAANGLAWAFAQKDAVKAICEASAIHVTAMVQRNDEIKGYKGKPEAAPKPLTWKEFEAQGEGGFLGNASQFRQVLEKLDPSDPLKLAPTSSTSDY